MKFGGIFHAVEEFIGVTIPGTCALDGAREQLIAAANEKGFGAHRNNSAPAGQRQVCAVSWLAGFEQGSNQGRQGARDGSGFSPREIHLVAITLSNGLQHGVHALTPIFSAEVRASVFSLQPCMLAVAMLLGRVKIRRVLQSVFELWFRTPGEGGLESGRGRELRESWVKRGPQFIAQETDPTARKWGVAG